MAVNQMLLSSLVSRIEMAQEEVNKFKEAFLKDPCNALAWAQPTFVAAAKLETFQSIYKLLSTDKANEELIVKVYNHYRKEALNAAAFPPASTSAAANIMKQSIGVAAVDAMELLECF